MTQADSVHSTPLVNTSAIPRSDLSQAIDGFGACPSFVRLTRVRDEAAAEIDRLLAYLDATDGDFDIEDGRA
jgi:hypothetical protein